MDVDALSEHKDRMIGIQLRVLEHHNLQSKIRRQRLRQTDAFMMIAVATVLTVIGLAVGTTGPGSWIIGGAMVFLGVLLYGKIVFELIDVRRELKEMEQEHLINILKGK